MAKSDKPDDKLRADADQYIEDLPGETAQGRMTTDASTPADTAAWEAEHARQEAALRGKNPGTTTPGSKKGNQPK